MTIKVVIVPVIATIIANTIATIAPALEFPFFFALLIILYSFFEFSKPIILLLVFKLLSKLITNISSLIKDNEFCKL